MFELFTAIFTVLFTLFVAAAIAGHVLLAQALLRMIHDNSEARGPSRQPAAAPNSLSTSIVVTGQ